MAHRKKRRRPNRGPGFNTYRERDPDGLDDYRAAEVGDNLSRDDLVDAMESLLYFTRHAEYKWEADRDIEALIYATVARSSRSFEGICLLLRSGLAVQAAMLCRSLFEDMIVGHWMLFNGEDPGWLVDRFLRQREAIALHQRKLRRETKASMGPPIPMAKDAKTREKYLVAEFGSEVQRDWWNPGRDGKGKGGAVKVRRIIGELEDAAANLEMFHPRFAGGEAALLRREELVANKWFNQCIHHTTLGLPFTLADRGKIEIPEDPMLMVSFTATWVFAQQVYLAHDVSGQSGREFEATFWTYMVRFSRAISPGGAAEVEKLEDQLEQMLSQLGWDNDDQGTAS